MLTRSKAAKAVTIVEPEEPQEPEEPKTFTCSVCYFDYPQNELPHFQCPSEVHEGLPRELCQQCFYRWISSSNQDNRGFRKVSCNCGREVQMDEVRAVLTNEQFSEYVKLLCFPI